MLLTARTAVRCNSGQDHPTEVIGLALLILFEKVVPAGHWLGYSTGIALLGWGAGMLALAF